MNIFNRLFKADYSVCTECGVHFEPISDYDAQVGILCQTHRKPAFELMRRKEFVQRWAALNWEKLEAQALKEELGSHSNLAGKRYIMWSSERYPDPDPDAMQAVALSE